MVKYECQICKKIEFKKGFQSETGHQNGVCIHGDVLVMMKPTKN